MKIFLYSTIGCHLCEQAKVMLWPLLLKYQYHLIEVDISTSDDMIEKYGTRIPVLSAGENTVELNWLFTPEQVDNVFAELAGL